MYDFPFLNIKKLVKLVKQLVLHLKLIKQNHFIYLILNILFSVLNIFTALENLISSVFLPQIFNK